MATDAMAIVPYVDFEDEKTEVTKLLDTFREETRKSKEELKAAAQKTRRAARTARRSDSVQNLKALSVVPPAKAEAAVKPPGE